MVGQKKINRSHDASSLNHLIPPFRELFPAPYSTPRFLVNCFNAATWLDYFLKFTIIDWTFIFFLFEKSMCGNFRQCSFAGWTLIRDPRGMCDEAHQATHILMHTNTWLLHMLSHSWYFSFISPLTHTSCMAPLYMYISWKLFAIKLPASVDTFMPLSTS